MLFKAMRRGFLLFLVALVAGCAGERPLPPPVPVDPVSALIADLKRGSYVFYWRHAETETKGEPEVRNLADCSWQRNLNAEGKRQAAAVGERFRLWGLSVRFIEASPFCRTRETAAIAFERPVRLNSDLAYHVSQAPEQIAAGVEKLKARFARRPRTPGNLLLVGHAPPLRDAVGIEVPEGHGVIVKPDGAGGFRVVARFSDAGLFPER